MSTTIGNPLSWSVDAARGAGHHLGAVAGRVGGEETDAAHIPTVRDIDMGDIRAALRAGAEDFAACRTDVAFLCLLYPVISVTLSWLALDRDLLPLLFPAISGFALLGPVAGVGLYEMSRRRELGLPVSWGDAFAVLRGPAFGAVLLLALLLGGIFLAWMITAFALSDAIMGAARPASALAYFHQVLTTGAGWTMIVVGCGVGFLYAAMVLVMSVVSFPLLLDRNVGVPVAVATSIRVARRNPGTVVLWGLIVAGALALGSIPLFLGLIVVLPILGHATWHLYRAAVVAPVRPLGG